ncbi:hypothetical protein C0J52_08504 [Blattella germanica]|nr:hypothetical protein C0J52_08504 [Blattella germanica]
MSSLSPDEYQSQSSSDEYVTCSSCTSNEAFSVYSSSFVTKHVKFNIREDFASVESDESTLVASPNESNLFEIDGVDFQNSYVSEDTLVEDNESIFFTTNNYLDCESFIFERARTSKPIINIVKHILNQNSDEFIHFESIIGSGRSIYWYTAETIIENEYEIIKMWRDRESSSVDDQQNVEDDTDLSTETCEVLEISGDSKVVKSENTEQADMTSDKRIWWKRLVVNKSLDQKYVEVIGLQTIQYKFKILLVGEIGAGKSAIMNRFNHNYFIETYRPNKTVDMCIKIINWNETTSLQLCTLIIPSEDKLTSLHCGDVNGVVFVHNVGKPDTLPSVARWKSYVDKNMKLPNGNSIPSMFLANKIDLEENDSFDILLKINSYCESMKFSAWFVTSSKDGTNIDRVFNFLISQMMQNQTTFENDTSAMHRNSLNCLANKDFCVCC